MSTQIHVSTDRALRAITRHHGDRSRIASAAVRAWLAQPDAMRWERERAALSGEPKDTFTVRVTPELHRALRLHAAAHGVTITDTVSVAVRVYLTDHTDPLEASYAEDVQDPEDLQGHR
ncbi:toxin-antitoxin system HicB family antitoxin [Arhodomonas sp. SL1]|uniref:toxin-antitoxin system HicB family antitoxin n=1 Tax=Arhodomonas sp. SL1 TaxID=3425691 RepID=UPI003F885719